MFSGDITLTFYEKENPDYTINFVNGVANYWTGRSINWKDYEGDPTVTGNSTNQRIWRYSVNSSTGAETHALCSKILLGANSATVTLNSNSTSENITNINTSFAWFYIGNNTNLFFLNGKYYDSQPEVTSTSDYLWTQVSKDDNYKKGTKYTLNVTSGLDTSISTNALNFDTGQYANESVEANEYVTLSGLTDKSGSGVGLYYFKGIFYTSAPSISGGTWTSYVNTSTNNTKYATIYGVNATTGKDEIGSGALHLYKGTVTISNTTYNLKNSTSYYASIPIGETTLYYFNGTFYTIAPSLKSENVSIPGQYVLATSESPAGRRYYTGSSGIMSKTAMSRKSGSNPTWYYAGYGDYWVSTKGGASSRGPITYWSDENVPINNVKTWYSSGTIYGNDGSYMNFNSGEAYIWREGTSEISYTGYTAPATSYKANETYNYTYENVNYRITINKGTFSSHQYQKAYFYSTPDAKADSTYYYTFGSDTYRIVISSGSYSSHEKRGAVVKTYYYKPTGNLLDSGDNGFQTNVDEYSDIYRYYFSEGSFAGIKVQSITDSAQHKFSTPTSNGYTDFYFWTKNADISNTATGSSGTRTLIYNDNPNGRIGLYFNSSGKLIRVRKSYPTNVEPTDFNDFLIFRCRSIWEGPSSGGSWNDNFGLVFINGYLYKISSTLGT